ncbi:hypothetical protein BGW38_002874, partial [Lunasporangiospora selenospora]
TSLASSPSTSTAKATSASVAPKNSAHDSTRRPSPKALLSRYLIQRLHFGYYGDHQSGILSDAVVRYLTARARLEFGYFVIRGRAFWRLTREDMGGWNDGYEDHNSGLEGYMGPLDTAVTTSDESRTTGLPRAGSSGTGQVIRLDPESSSSHHYVSSSSSPQRTGTEAVFNGPDRIRGITSSSTTTFGTAAVESVSSSAVVSDPNGYKDDEPNMTAAATPQAILTPSARRRTGAVLTGMTNATTTTTATVTGSSDSTEAKKADNILALDKDPPKTEIQAAVLYWRRVALASMIDLTSDLDDAVMTRQPPSPFLSRRIDGSWMEYLQRPAWRSPYMFTDPTVTVNLPKPLLYDRGGMGMVQDDARLFQISTGIFDGLATHPKKWKRPVHNIIDGPLTKSLDVARSLVMDYGYLPMPEDDGDRMFHYTGGKRITTGETEKYPSDGTHVVNRRELKGQGSSIWYFYDLQRVEIMTVYLMYRAPEILDLMFEQGFELWRPPEELQGKEGQLPFSRRGLGVSSELLLRCCLPECHSMVRHVYKPFPPAGTGSVNSGVRLSMDTVIRVTKEMVLGAGIRPKRFTFSRGDFVHVLRGISSERLKESLLIMRSLGMDISAVRERFTEVLQSPGGTSPIVVEWSVLEALHSTLLVEWSVGEPLACGHFRLPKKHWAMYKTYSDFGDSLGDSTLDSTSARDFSALDRVFGFLGRADCPTCATVLPPVDVVNMAIEESFRIDMDFSHIQEWESRHDFEEMLVHLVPEAFNMNPYVASWIMDNFKPEELSFKICFDHALMEALAGIMNRNRFQVRRLYQWVREKSKWLKRTMVEKEGGVTKHKLVIFRQTDDELQEDLDDGQLDVDHWGEEEDRGEGAVDEDGDVKMQEKGNRRIENISVDIDWTTSDRIDTTMILLDASMSGGDRDFDIQPVDQDYILVEDGSTSLEILMEGEGNETHTEDGRSSLDLSDSQDSFGHYSESSSRSSHHSRDEDDEEDQVGDRPVLNINLCLDKFLKRGAIVEKKHLIWVALGLVTESFHGRQSVTVYSKSLGRDAAPSLGRGVPYRVQTPLSEAWTPESGSSPPTTAAATIPVKMACSAEAYQLVWMITFAYIQQSVRSTTPTIPHQGRPTLLSEGSTGSSPSSTSTQPSVSMSHLGVTGSGSTRETCSPPASPVPLSSIAMMVRDVQQDILKQIGARASLMIEILAEIEAELEDRVVEEEL